MRRFSKNFVFLKNRDDRCDFTHLIILSSSIDRCQENTYDVVYPPSKRIIIITMIKRKYYYLNNDDQILLSSLTSSAGSQASPGNSSGHIHVPSTQRPLEEHSVFGSPPMGHLLRSQDKPPHSLLQLHFPSFVQLPPVYDEIWVSREKTNEI